VIDNTATTTHPPTNNNNNNNGKSLSRKIQNLTQPMGIEPSQCAALKHVKILAYTMETENTNNKSHTKTVN